MSSLLLLLRSHNSLLPQIFVGKTISVMRMNMMRSSYRRLSLSSTLSSSRSTLLLSSSTITMIPNTLKPIFNSQKASSSLFSTASAPYDHSIPNHEFPSIIIRSSKYSNTDDVNNSINNIIAQGTFAKAQAMYLNPDIDIVNQLVHCLKKANVGIVAHYYMDVELQGILQAVNTILPGRVGIADSLKMGDMAIEMIKQYNCSSIICLGVDFMSESVSSIIYKNGYTNIPVYRATITKIGCSLSESAERDSYRAWLYNESNNINALHVIYINTSLETKAISNDIVPTITCTSSNVLQTILTASYQMNQEGNGNKPYKILYGPDTYMGNNLVTLLDSIINNPTLWTNERIQKELHVHHTIDTLKLLRNSIVVYPSGNCIVHHMFGESVVNTVKEYYMNDNNCYITAHLEVPGEMFQLALQKSFDNDAGVVGSTSDILHFITRKVTNYLTTSDINNNNIPHRLRFILGTEAGMVTSIVYNIQQLILQYPNSNIEVEIIFPVASDAISAVSDNNDTNLVIVPGVQGGEGCSTAGGCATCPYMKMNSIDSVLDLLQMIQEQQQYNNEKQLNHNIAPTTNNNNSNELILLKHLPPNKLRGKLINGISAIELGIQPIMYMRDFNTTKLLPNDLIQRIMKH